MSLFAAEFPAIRLTALSSSLDTGLTGAKIRPKYVTYFLPTLSLKNKEVSLA